MCIAFINGFSPLPETFDYSPVATLNNLARVYTFWGARTNNVVELRRAFPLYSRALEAAGEQTDLKDIRGRILSNLAQAYIYLSFYEQPQNYREQALNLLQQALTIQQELGDRAKTWETISYIGWIYDLQGNQKEALEYYRRAIDLLETLTAEGIAEFKIRLNAQAAETYQRIILLLWQSRRFEEAFEFSERARARVLLDEISNLGEKRRNDQIDATLLHRKTILQQEISALEQQTRVSKDAVGNEHITAQLTAKQREYTDVLINIKVQGHPVVTNGKILTLKEIQAILSQSSQDRTLLSYFVTPEKTLAFVITHAAFIPVELPVKKHKLTEAILKMRDMRALPDDSPIVLHDLYDVLVAPLKEKLTTPLIGIIPHDILHYLPYAALSDGEHLLNDQYALFSLPSASMLTLIQKQSGTANKTILSMANTDGGRLPNADREAQAIARLYHAEAFTGVEASKAVFKAQAGKVDLVHITTHGEFNSVSPLFSYILFAPDRTTHDDGKLALHEIYEMNLQQTDLVVLSVCDTQIGEQSRGDDIVSLNRAFMQAASASVIATLWKVADEPTKEFMIMFYKQLKHGKSKAEALRIAQQKMRSCPGYAHPYYWAGFVLTGDPGLTIVHTSWGKIGEIIALVGGIMLIWLWKRHQSS